MGMGRRNGGVCRVVPSAGRIPMVVMGRADGSVICTRTILAPRVGMITLFSGLSLTGFVRTTEGWRPAAWPAIITPLSPLRSELARSLEFAVIPVALS